MCVVRQGYRVDQQVAGSLVMVGRRRRRGGWVRVAPPARRRGHRWGRILPRVRALARVWAINFGLTRTALCPAPRRSCSRRVDICRQSSIPQSRSGPNSLRAQAIACWCPLVVAGTVNSPSCLPTASTATNVCEALCTSTPTTTMVVASWFTSVGTGRSGRSAGTPQ